MGGEGSRGLGTEVRMWAVIMGVAMILQQNSGSVGGTVTRSNTSSALSELSDSRPRTAALDNAYK